MAAVGVGAVIGSLGASLLVGTGRLGAWFAVGVALWGLPHRARRRLSPAGGGAVPALVRRRRQRPDRRRRVHAHRQAGSRRGAGARLRRAGEPRRRVHRARGHPRLDGDRVVRASRPRSSRSGWCVPSSRWLVAAQSATPGPLGRRPRRGHRAAPAGAHVPPPAAARRSSSWPAASRPSRCPQVRSCSPRATSATATT